MVDEKIGGGRGFLSLKTRAYYSPAAKTKGVTFQSLNELKYNCDVSESEPLGLVINYKCRFSFTAQSVRLTHNFRIYDMSQNEFIPYKPLIYVK